MTHTGSTAKQRLQRFEESDQIFFFLRGKVQAEGVAFDCVSLDTVGSEAGGYIVVVQALGIQPVFQRGAPTAVTEQTPVPYTG
jgi:hypothetical protein